jgi:GTP-binding protein
MNVPVVALVGRPNVGKSALFNRLIGENAAIVSDEAGTTRDRHFARSEWAGRAFFLVDTGGITEDPRAPLDTAIRRQVEQAIGEADLLLHVVDARSGLHPVDSWVADELRSSGKPTLLVVNKVDDPRDAGWYEFFALGEGDPHPVSAMNGRQTGDLLDAIVARIPVSESGTTAALRVAVIGRPNVGKSSLVNRLLGEERLVVAAEAGTTRDAIDAAMRYHAHEIVFVDTAGLRRQARMDEGIEFYSALRTRRAIERADICCLVLDATEGLHNQDLKIASLAWESGCGLIVVVNKWDLFEKDDKSAVQFEKSCREKAPYLTFVPFLFTSAVTGQRVTRLLELILEVAAERTKRITTSEVNDRLGELVARRQPPQAAGRDIRLLYATQVAVSPPTFAVFGNHPDLLEEHYVRYLHNGFREAWGFRGNPVRIVLRRRAA